MKMDGNQSMFWTECPYLPILSPKMFLSLSMPNGSSFCAYIRPLQSNRILVLIIIYNTPRSNSERTGHRVIHVMRMPLSWNWSVEILCFYWECGRRWWMVNQYLCWTEWPYLLILFLQILLSLSMPYENHFMEALGFCSLMEFLVLTCISDFKV